MARFVVYLVLPQNSGVEVEVQANTQEELNAGMERARQSDVLMLRGIGKREGSIRMIAGAEIRGYVILDPDTQSDVSYTLALPA